MDGDRFDRIARGLASAPTRRRLLGALVAGALGLAGVGGAEAAACRAPGRTCREGADCCSGRCNPTDARGRRRCGCRTVDDCPAAPACRTVACRAGVCVAGVAAPVDCVVSDWGDFSACSAACGGGTQTRTRSVVVPASCGGQGCPDTVETQPCNAQACGTCDATQAAAFCSTVTAVDDTQHCGRPNFGACCDTDADCAISIVTCSNVVPQFCAKTSQLGTGAPSAVTCAADPSKAGGCCCLAACDLPA